MRRPGKAPAMTPLGNRRYLGKRIGEYTILSLIGAGRYGVCFSAQTASGEKVLIKKFRPGMFKKNEKKNMHEAVILSQLRDPRIPELLGVVNQKCFYGFVLEYKPGSTLRDMLFKEKYKFTSKEIYHIGSKLIAIVQYLHGHGVVHRDVRTPNVLVDGNEVYLIDFGLARWADPGKYPFSLDYSFLGDTLLYLLYSSYEAPAKRKKAPWYEELTLTDGQRCFLQRLMGLKPVYHDIHEIEEDFLRCFHCAQ
jgi:serine/threonine-protein kinase